MRHDPAGAAIVIMLRSLKLPGMALAVNDLLEQGHPRSMQPFRYYRSCLKLRWPNARCAPSLIT